MSISESVRATLQSFAGGRVYPNTFPQGATPTWPAIRYTIVSAVPAVSLEGDSGIETADVRVQIDLVTKHYKEGQTLRGQVITAMASHEPPAIWDGEFNDFDPETKTHRCTLDYLIYPSSDDGSSP